MVCRHRCFRLVQCTQHSLFSNIESQMYFDFCVWFSFFKLFLCVSNAISYITIAATCNRFDKRFKYIPDWIVVLVFKAVLFLIVYTATSPKERNTVERMDTSHIITDMKETYIPKNLKIFRRTCNLVCWQTLQTQSKTRLQYTTETWTLLEFSNR